jgi:cytochrome c
MLRVRAATVGMATAALLAAGAAVAERFPGIGRGATPAEIKAWDIDVRPDFKGLPPGSGSVARGEKVWDAQCASCHGTFGESNEVFTPIVGNTRISDQKSGRVAALSNPEIQRTTLMKLSTLSTLWDYINRAMPWNAPKTLTTEEVYAVTAYILHLGDIVPRDFILSDRNIADVQAKLPNRNGKTLQHGLWSVRGKPDVRATACMRDCKVPKVASQLPDFARGSHGDLAQQQRGIGPTRGIALASGGTPNVAVEPPVDPVVRHGCGACHQPDRQLVGPSYAAVSERYRSDAAAASKLVESIRNGSSGKWGNIPMPAHAAIGADDLNVLVARFLKGAQ